MKPGRPLTKRHFSRQFWEQVLWPLSSDEYCCDCGQTVWRWSWSDRGGSRPPTLLGASIPGGVCTCQVARALPAGIRFGAVLSRS